MNYLYKSLPEIKIFLDDDLFLNNLNNNFRYSISLNPTLEKEIINVYNRALLNSGKLTLNVFHLSYLEIFEELVKTQDNKEDLFEFSNSLIKLINRYFEKLDSNLFLKSEKDLEKLKNILKISLILMEGSVKDLDIELAYESFFQVERRIKKEKLYKDSFEFKHTYGDYELNISLKNNNTIIENYSKEVNTPLDVEESS